jgi:hypothetical protein
MTVNTNIYSTSIKLNNKEVLQNISISNLPYEIIQNIFSNFIITLPDLRNTLLTCKTLFVLGRDCCRQKIYHDSNLIFTIVNNKSVKTVQHLLEKNRCKENFLRECLEEALKANNVQAVKELMKNPRLGQSAISSIRINYQNLHYEALKTMLQDKKFKFPYVFNGCYWLKVYWVLYSSILKKDMAILELFLNCQDFDISVCECSAVIKLLERFSTHAIWNDDIRDFSVQVIMRILQHPTFNPITYVLGIFTASIRYNHHDILRALLDHPKTDLLAHKKDFLYLAKKHQQSFPDAAKIVLKEIKKRERQQLVQKIKKNLKIGD